MPFIFQKFIYREDLKANPTVTYIFGDNCGRQGFGGQAKEMRGEPNAFGIPTKWTPFHNEAAYFYEHQLTETRNIIDIHFREVQEMLRKGKTIVFPLDGIGTGLSKLPEHSPTLDQYIKNLVRHMGVVHMPVRPSE